LDGNLTYDAQPTALSIKSEGVQAFIEHALASPIELRLPSCDQAESILGEEI